MVSPYLLKRRLRHLRSITLNNIAIELQKQETNSSKNPLCEIIRLIECFYVIESVNGETLFVSEIQNSSFRQVQFNDLNFQGDTESRFIFKILVEIPSELINNVDHSENDKIWCTVRSIQIDLNKMQLIDLKKENIHGFNIPVFLMDDGYYTPTNVEVERGTNTLSSDAQELVSTKLNQQVKKSFKFNTVLKMTKLLEYLYQAHEETNNLSNKLAATAETYNEQNDRYFKNVKNYKQQLQRKVLKSSMEIKRLKEVLNNCEALNSLDTENLTDISKKNIVNENYGNTTSDLYQTRNTINYFRSKKLKQIIGIFRTLYIFELAEDTNNSYIHSIISKAYKDINKTNELILHSLDSRKLINEINRSEESLALVNTYLGYYSLLIKLISTEIFNISLPNNIMFYGSTSVINKSHPLYLSSTYSLQNLKIFGEAISLLNIDILHIKQYLKYHYSS